VLQGRVSGPHREHKVWGSEWDNIRVGGSNDSYSLSRLLSGNRKHDTTGTAECKYTLWL